eukprot:TRINITY_DN66604_c2_g2_i1.p1 TRINITY_DN66604_c2_g2~~TRINITY_DN66604_c2_g2_i1.p1  ORF type:complete len:447 (+),score=230.18 TRINITY_DN66604_c2_g2_i1:63-1403(+)
MNVQVKVTPSSSSSDGPQLVSFPRGAVLPVINHAGEDGEKDAEFRLYANVAKRRRLMHCSMTAGGGDADEDDEDDDDGQGSMQYFSMMHANASRQPNTYGVGVFDAKSGTVTVAPVPLLYPMQQLDAAVTVDEEDDGEGEKEADEDRSAAYRAKQKMLVEQFGSKKRKRMLRSREANMINLDGQQNVGDVQQQLQNTMRNKQKLLAASSSSSSNSSSSSSSTPSAEAGGIDHGALLPAFNAETKVVSEIYDWNSIIPEAVAEQLEFRTLLKASKKTALAEKLASDRYPKFVLQMLPELQQTSRKEEVRAAKTLMFLNFLLRFHHVNMRSKNRNGELADRIGAPQPVADHLLRTFTERQGRNMVCTEQMQHKVLCHVCVLAQLCSRYHLLSESLKSLASDLKLSTDKVWTYMRQIGCVRGADKQTTVLKAPLKLPGLRKPGRGGGRR